MNFLKTKINLKDHHSSKVLIESNPRQGIVGDGMKMIPHYSFIYNETKERKVKGLAGCTKQLYKKKVTINRI